MVVIVGVWANTGIRMEGMPEEAASGWSVILGSEDGRTTILMEHLVIRTRSQQKYLGQRECQFDR